MPGAWSPEMAPFRSLLYSCRNPPRSQDIYSLFAESRLGPDGVPDGLDTHFTHARFAQQARANIVHNEVHRRASHCCKGQLKGNNAVLLLYIDNQAHIDHADGDLRVLYIA